MSALEAGKLFERYRIIRQLGSGISGESYEAEDIILLRKVTLKLIHPWTALSDAARRQFFREMQGISILNHPYLASILDYGEVNGKLYVARRYVSSGSLLGNDGRLWYRPPLSISDAIYYGHQLAQALEYIHKHGCLHGSLGFANILVLRGPNPDNESSPTPFLLADVGLANFVRRFGEPQIKLLPITAAPEQLGQRVTQASDQFALAVLIYFWLAGRPPYLGTPEEVEEQKLTETIPPLHSLNSKASIEQDVVLRRALTVYPEDRYPSVLAFANALLATLPAQMESDTGTRSTTHQLADTPQGESHEALEEIKATPAVDEAASVVAEAKIQADAESEFGGDAGSPVSQLETQPISELKPDVEPMAAEFQVDVEDETQSRIAGPETDTEQEAVAELTEDAPELQQGSDSISQPAPDVPQPAPDPVPQPVPDVPQPLPTPDVPEPTHDPIPQPAPDPIPQPAPDVPPQVPDPVPQVVPDVPQPLPEPDAPPFTPEPSAQSEPVAGEELPLFQEAVSSPQDSEQEQETEPRIEESETAHLIIMSPYAEESYEVVLERDETTIGRAGSSDVLLDHDNSTSRHHALLKREGDHYVLYDRRSANGVFVNGQMLMGEMGYVLEDGDHISIGNYELIFRCKRPEVAAEAEESASESETVTSWSFF